MINWKQLEKFQNSGIQCDLTKEKKPLCENTSQEKCQSLISPFKIKKSEGFFFSSYRLEVTFTSPMRRAPVQKKKRYVSLYWRNHIIFWVSWQVLLLLNPFTCCIFMNFCLLVFYEGTVFFCFCFCFINQMIKENEPEADRLNGSNKQIVKWNVLMFVFKSQLEPNTRTFVCSFQICQVLRV